MDDEDVSKTLIAGDAILLSGSSDRDKPFWATVSELDDRNIGKLVVDGNTTMRVRFLTTGKGGHRPRQEGGERGGAVVGAGLGRVAGGRARFEKAHTIPSHLYDSVVELQKQWLYQHLGV